MDLGLYTKKYNKQFKIGFSIKPKMHFLCKRTDGRGVEFHVATQTETGCRKYKLRLFYI